ncbi:MAG: hypothetical protein HY833_03385 [Candidatus Aenigmarchaeota archaeon]|nr:hypothetical protein [Candidatus Aenigmarchaeota archaeon]
MKDDRLFEIKINFKGHSVYSLDERNGLPRTSRCSVKDHSGCRVGDYVKGEIEQFYKNEVKVKDYEVGKSGDGGSIRVLISVPVSYNKNIMKEMKETFRECDDVFNRKLGDLTEILVKHHTSNYSLKHRMKKSQTA